MESTPPRRQNRQAISFGKTAVVPEEDSLDSNVPTSPRGSSPRASPRSGMKDRHDSKVGWNAPSLDRNSKAGFRVGSNRSIRPPVDVMREAIMSETTGVNVGDNKVKLRTYPQTFVASEAVEWLLVTFFLSREEGVELLQSFLDDGWMKHANGNASVFTDSPGELFQWLKERCGTDRDSLSFSAKPSSLGSIMNQSMHSILGRKRTTGLIGECDVREGMLEGPYVKSEAGDTSLSLTKRVREANVALRSMSLVGLELDPDFLVLPLFKQVRDMSTLKRLDLSNNRLDVPTVAALFEGWDAPSLRDLRLDHNVTLQSGSSKEEFFWTALLQRLRLETLDISSTSIGDASLGLLTRLLVPNTSLRNFLADETCFTSAGQLLLCEVLQGSAVLKTLFLSKASKAVERMKKIDAPLPGLRRSIKSQEIAARIVEALMKNTSLTCVMLDTGIVDHGNNYTNLSRIMRQNESLNAECRVSSCSHRLWKSIPAFVCSLRNMVELDLSNNHLTNLPWSLLRLQLLEKLDVSRNSILLEGLPVHAAFFPRLHVFDVTENPLVAELPKEINWRNTNELLKFITARCDQKFVCKQMRVIVLGDPNSGRSSVASRIINPHMSPSAPPTAPINITQCSMSEDVTVQVWDFAREVVALPAHRFFLIPDSVYVVVFNLTDPSSIDRTSYWLDLIAGKVTESCHLVIVGTRGDRVESVEGLIANFRKRYRSRPGIKLHSVIAANAKGSEDVNIWVSLQTLLLSIARYEMTSWVGMGFPQKFVSFRGMLLAERDLLAVPVISLSALRIMARSCKIREQEMDVCFSWLQYSGAAMFFDSVPNLKELVLLDLMWLVDVISLLSSCKKPMISHEELTEMFPCPQYTAASLSTVVQLLEGFSVLHVFTHTAGAKYLIPFLLPETEPALPPEDVTIIKQHIGHKYVRIYETPAAGVMFDQLIICLMHLASRYCSFWREGFIFMMKDSNFGMHIISGRVIKRDDTISRIIIETTTADRSGRVLHLVCSTFESLVRGWFPGSEVRRLVAVANDQELDLDVLFNKLMSLSSDADLRNFMRDELALHQDEIPDVLLNHTSRVRWPDLQVITELGAGAYGTVLKAKFDGELVAVKQVRSAEMLCISQPQLFSLFLQECWAMNFLRHPKVISMIGVCFQPMSMILEFMELGDLRKYLDSHVNLTWDVRLKLLIDIAEGMTFAHGLWPPMFHKDLKSPNVFLTQDSQGTLTAKVADLGLAEVLPKASKVQGVDNPIWAAVEVIQGGMCTEKADVWSFAIMMWEMLYPSDFPYNDALASLGWMSLVSDAIVHSGLRPTVNETLPATSSAPPGFVALMRRAWETDPQRRPSFVEILLTLRRMLCDLLTHSNAGKARLELIASLTPTAPVASYSIHEDKAWLTMQGLDTVLSLDLLTSSMAPLSHPDFLDGISRVTLLADGVVYSRRNADSSLCFLSWKQFRQGDSVGASSLKIRDCPESAVTVKCGRQVLAVGRLLKKLVLAEVNVADRTTSRIAFLPTTEVGESEDLALSCIAVPAQHQVWVLCAQRQIFAVDIKSMSVVLSLSCDSPLSSLINISSLSQVWGLERDTNLFAVWNLQGERLGSGSLPRRPLASSYAPSLDVLLLYDLRGLCIVRPQAPDTICSRAQVTNAATLLRIDDLLDGPEISKLEDFAGTKGCAHFIQFLVFMGELRAVWDRNLSKTVLTEYLKPDHPKSVLHVTRFPDGTEFSRENIFLVESDVKVWVQDNLVLPYADQKLRSKLKSDSINIVHIPSLHMVVVSDQRVHLFHLGTDELGVATPPMDGSTQRSKTAVEVELEQARQRSKEAADGRMSFLLDAHMVPQEVLMQEGSRASLFQKKAT